MLFIKIRNEIVELTAKGEFYFLFINVKFNRGTQHSYITKSLGKRKVYIVFHLSRNSFKVVGALMSYSKTRVNS